MAIETFGPEAPRFIRSSLADKDTDELITALANQVTAYRLKNDRKRNFYEGRYAIRDLGLSIPPELRSLGVVVGWPGTAVDVLEERLDFLGWAQTNGDLGLDQVYTDNALDSDSSECHLDALLYGCSFVAVGSGEDDEPSPLITVESPQDMTGYYDRRKRRLEAALLIDEEDHGEPMTVVLYLPESTSRYVKEQGRWRMEYRDDHGLGRTPVVLVANRPRGSRPEGRSEITRAVRHYTLAAGRTLLGMEVHREFYQAPQRYVLGAAEEAFQRPDGSKISQWETIMGRVWALERDEDGDLPTVGQFPQSQPGPYLDQVKGLAQLFAAECGIPASYLGFYTQNPSSADAIRAGEARLVKRAERRQVAFGHAWLEVARLALLIRDGAVPDDLSSMIRINWRDAATPTRAAQADEATKLVGSGILTPDSRVTYSRIGLTPQEMSQLESDKLSNPSDMALIANALQQQNQPAIEPVP